MAENPQQSGIPALDYRGATPRTRRPRLWAAAAVGVLAYFVMLVPVMALGVEESHAWDRISNAATWAMLFPKFLFPANCLVWGAAFAAGAGVWRWCFDKKHSTS